MQDRRGSILILILFVMTVLSLAAMSFAYRAGLKSRQTHHRAVAAQLVAQARSAVSVAMSWLKENTNEFDHPAEPWHSHPPLASEDWPSEWSGEDSAFQADYLVIDEEGKLNLTFASGQALESLGMTTEQIASLFDWMDADDIVRAEGAEKDYYLALPDPYRCKNAPLEFLEELTLIRNMGPAGYRAGPATYDADQSGGLGWADLLTVVGDGRINLNTAPQPVLRTLPISENAVGQIVGFRAFDANSSGLLSDHAFRSESDIEQLQGLTDAEREVLKSMGTFQSRHFRIIAEARHLLSGLQCRIEVLVRTGYEEPEILQWKVWP